jgi:hypothetical protein
MNYREVELLAPESITTTGVRTIDLGTDQPVSRLDVMWRKTNTNHTALAHPAKIIERIDVVDGSDVLFSMNGSDAQAMGFFTSGHQPGSMLNYAGGQWSMMIASIYFGRKMWDELYALDPKKHNNIQIKIAHNIINGGATGTVGDLSIYAHVFNDKIITPKGFVQCREIYSFLPVANAWTYIDMPQDYPIRGLMFGANEAEQGPEYNVVRFKVSENGGKNILAESTMERYLLVQSGNLEPWNEKLICEPLAAATDFHTYVTPHWERTPVMESEGAGLATAHWTSAGCLVHMQCAGGAPVLEGIVQGFAPFGQTWIPFAGVEEDGGWETVGKGNSRIDLQADASCDVDEFIRVAVNQLRRY